MEMNSSLSKQKGAKRKSNQMDKICSKLQISVKDINAQNQLPKPVKLRIQKYIEHDQVRQLHGYLEKKVLTYEVEIGIKSMRWNILHFAAKNNALKTLQVILAKTYQQSPQKYKQLVNKQTFQGYTPLMITIIYCAKECFLLLLQYGGSDLQCVDNKNMTAYDLALNYKNEFAIKQLMGYVSANGKKKDGMFVNEQLLMKPIKSSLYQEANCCSKFFDCFVDLFICFKRNDNDDDFQTQRSNEIKQLQNPCQPQQSFLKNNFYGSKLLSLLKNSQEVQVDMVPVGNKQIESKYSIEWKKLTLSNNQKPVLFDCFQPFDICQNNLIIANNLIIFQCLSDHTWLIRKLMKQIKKGDGSNNNINDLPNQYSIQSYFNDELRKVTVDEFIPFLKQRSEPMFLSNLNQMWPQILQKGLAKIHGSYMNLSEIKPATFLQNLTGFYTKSFALQEGMTYFKDQDGQFIRDKQIMTVLQDFNSKGYMILLEGRQGTSLTPKNSPAAFRSYCYTILNFYQKGSKRLILVNCPYVLNSWKEKEKNEIMQLKLIKSHYNSHNQMCVWIDESQFAHFFKNAIVSFVQPNIARTQMKIRYLLENQIEAKPQNKIMNIFQNFTSSAKNIFGSKTQKRDSTKSSSGDTKNTQPRISIKLIPEPVQKFKTVSKLVFIKFKVQNSKNSEYLSLAIKDNTNHTYCRIKKFKGWIDGGLKDLSFQQSNVFSPDLIKIQHKKGEYLCMFEVQFKSQINGNDNIIIKSSRTVISNKSISLKDSSVRDKKQSQQNNSKRSSIQVQKTIKKHELLVVCWSQEPIQLQHIEEEFAVIDCLESCRKNSIKNWSFTDKKILKSETESTFKYIYEKFDQKIILMTKSSKKTRISLRFNGDQETKSFINDYIHEGNFLSIDQKESEDQNETEYSLDVEFVPDFDHQQYQYVVLGGNQAIFKSIEDQNFKLDTLK